LANSLGGLMAAGLPGWFARELLAAEQEKDAAAPRKVAANDKINFGIIGTGDRFGLTRTGENAGNVDANFKPRGLFTDFSRFPGWQIVAVCDVDKFRRDISAKRAGGKVDAYNDYRELVARKDVDAVIIVTPDHWHTLPAIAAARAGKDIYLEKPMTLTVAEGRPLIKAVRDNKRILAIGSQQRADGRFRLACELVRNNRIGQLKRIETRIGAADRGGPFATAPVPEGLDWDFWLGQTPKVDYTPQRCHYQFRWWYEYSGGKGTDWGAHHNDIAQWALGKDGSGPVSVESAGEAPNIPNGYNCHTKFTVTYQYPNNVTLVCKSDGENGVRFEGDKGWIFVNRGKIEASDKKLLDEPLPASATRLYVATNHQGNWLECLRSRKDPICPVEVGHSSVTVCHLGNISLRLGGRKFTWDPEKERASDEDANKMLSREMRAPWKLEA
jgi:predicted dehydrogenase